MAWNHRAHICNTDLLFALGLRSSTTGGLLPSSTRSPSTHRESRGVLRARETSHRCSCPSDGGKPSREDELEAAIARRKALQVALVRQKKRHSGAAARLEAFEVTRDEMLKKLDYNTTSLHEGEKNHASLETASRDAEGDHTASPEADRRVLPSQQGSRGPQRTQLFVAAVAFLSADRLGDVEAYQEEEVLSRIKMRGAKFRQRRHHRFTGSRSAPIKL